MTFDNEDTFNYMPREMLIINLIDSIRSLDARINELEMINTATPLAIPDDRRLKVLNRIQSLRQTRECLVETLISLENIK